MRIEKTVKARAVCAWLAISVLGLVLAGCSPKGGKSTASPPVFINAAGSTFGYPIYSRWAEAFHREHPTVQINYQAIGSGGGIRQLLAGTVDLGASDAPMTEAQMTQAKVPILHFPTVLGAVVPTYNIPGFTGELKFTPQALAGIFLGKITRWDDPAITQSNPGITLPNAAIAVIHRSDGSGTTFIWTDYLSKVSAEWKAKVGAGTSVGWPVGVGGKGSAGVTALIQEIPYSISYVELTYALQNHVLYGSVQNSSGTFIRASLSSVTAAAASAAQTMPSDFRVSITDPPGEDAYPIASFTWLLVPAEISNAPERRAVKSFLRWMLTDGQGFAALLGYARLPRSVIAKETVMISRIR